ncbi:phosphonate ABC transporter, permease protein PhnE [Aquibium sp. A9E412]|uniref:phosphonate ABC transporter, permease protein PhnE n=1 Tax=Aquibium sp. A9E412 TaxID=2976767 RepID=UPI0025B2534A|nr:phosphonate ABC transporter, permease protein PhnE [Aquibium sp. A9E412]MDN2565906.1 phosphonate ABC transporter, permease protein PhnE [Aquibium sp. A9E412]
MTVPTTLDPAALDDLAARHEAVFRAAAVRRRTGLLIAAATAGYLVFAWWFFSIGAVLSNGNWGIAGPYLADWISYEVRPDVEFEDGHLAVTYPRFSPLGPAPDPDWVETETALVEIPVAPAEGAVEVSPDAAEDGFLGPDGRAGAAQQGFLGPVEGGGSDAGEGFLGPDEGTTAPAAPQAERPAAPRSREREVVMRATVHLGGAARVAVEPGLVRVTRGGETVVFDIVRDESVTARGPLPAWIEQAAPGRKAVARFGFAGRAEIEDDEVKLRRRFLGWENFFFDTTSPFWGRPAGEVARLVLFGEPLEAGMSNAALAWQDFVTNAEWQHGDVWLKLLQTIVMAFAGTVLATLLAFPLSFLAARNVTPNRLVNQVLKRFFDFLRSVDMLIWALFFTRAFGPGPLAGISAIFFTDTGTFGKLYSEALENVDDRQREGIRSVGAAPVLVQRFGVMPQVLPVFVSQSLYFWESNTRSATIIGAVGAGGIGLKLWEAMRTNADWENVAYMVLLILAVVFLFDNISNMLRRRLIGGTPSAA